MKFFQNKRLFSFKIDGVDAWSCKYTEKISRIGNEIVTKYEFENGLAVTNIAKKHEKYGVYEWMNVIENTSEKSSGIISEFWDCDVELPLAHEENRKWEAYFPNVKTATKIYAPTGSTWGTKEFFCDVDEMHDNRRENHIYPNETKEYKTSGGRSSEARAPFFDINKNGEGYIVAIGWTGQWLARITRMNDSVFLRTKIEDTHFRMMAGEKFRTSSVAIMPYSLKSGELTSHNRWRKFVKEVLSPIGKKKLWNFAPLCAGVWGGMPSNDIIKRIEKISTNQLPFELLWVDAGWYGIDTKPTPNEFEGDWPVHTGDWRVSPLIHPKRLKDVSEAAHNVGLKFLLWFEPERVIKSTPMAQEHPDWFFKDCGEESQNYLLNLGNEEAWHYCYNMLSEAIETLHIDCYRQDFNMSPLEYWRRADAEDRQGISEIKHIGGLYRLWDRLLEKFPHLLIDNCASGGRRIDVETLKRSVPLWRSDAQCPANYDIESVQNHNLAFNLWMPYSGTGTGRIYDEYRIRSSYAAGLTTNYSFSQTERFCDTQEKTEFIRKYTQEYLKLRPYFSEDFYPLTEITGNTDTWCAMQFHCSARGDGIVQIFRRENSPYEMARFELKGLSSCKNYLFKDIDGGETMISGDELAENGFIVTVNEKRKAKIFMYAPQK